MQNCEVRCHTGPLAKEIFALCRPDTAEKDIVGQTASVYRALCDAVQLGGGSTEHILREMVFFQNIQRDLEPFQKARTQIMNSLYAPAATFVQQTPIRNEEQLVELSAYALIPRSGSLISHSVTQSGRVFMMGGFKHVFLGNIFGIPGNAEDEAYSMFQAAGEQLQKEGLSFRNVIRTWIHFRQIDRDYPGLNRGRTRYFRELGLAWPPASTGIEGTPPLQTRRMSLSLYAMEHSAHEVQCMSTPTLNEAWTYGADFSRGVKVVGLNGINLFISGTASVDEQGSTVHENDFQAQAERMILNISTLFEKQNASWSNVVSAITYLKNPADAPRLKKIFERKGMDGFPNVLVQAHVCRRELLCEMEAIATLPLSH
jgi:enamine deaminase RidA (YjgF/YER057c/UK114 family)